MNDIMVHIVRRCHVTFLREMVESQVSFIHLVLVLFFCFDFLIHQPHTNSRHDQAEEIGQGDRVAEESSAFEILLAIQTPPP